jgi:hypothetical protein
MSYLKSLQNSWAVISWWSCKFYLFILHATLINKEPKPYQINFAYFKTTSGNCNSSMASIAVLPIFAFPPYIWVSSLLNYPIILRLKNYMVLKESFVSNRNDLKG